MEGVKARLLLEIDAADFKELGGQKRLKVGYILEQRNLYGQKYVDGNEKGCLEKKEKRKGVFGRGVSEVRVWWDSEVNAELRWH